MPDCMALSCTVGFIHLLCKSDDMSEYFFSQDNLVGIVQVSTTARIKKRIYPVWVNCTFGKCIEE